MRGGERKREGKKEKSDKINKITEEVQSEEYPWARASFGKAKQKKEREGESGERGR